MAVVITRRESQAGQVIKSRTRASFMALKRRKESRTRRVLREDGESKQTPQVEALLSVFSSPSGPSIGRGREETKRSRERDWACLMPAPLSVQHLSIHSVHGLRECREGTRRTKTQNTSRSTWASSWWWSRGGRPTLQGAPPLTR